MFYEETRPKQDLSYISICSLSILYNSKFILMATSLETNAVVVGRVHCITLMCFQIITWSSLDWFKSDLGNRWEIDSILGTTFDLVVHICMTYCLGQYLSTVLILANLVLVQAVVLVLLFGPYYAWASPGNIPAWIKKRIHPDKIPTS